MTARFTLSAFGDEIDADVDEQLRVLNELDIGYLELRSVWGTNVLDLSDEQVNRLAERCEAHSVRVSCIGSPIGKSQIGDPLEKVVVDLRRILDIAEMVSTDRVRVFSFYPEVEGQQAGLVGESISRLSVMAEVAGERNVMLMLENEGGLVGDTPERCHAIVDGVGSPNLRYVWDTGNYPQMGFERSVEIGWSLLAEYTVCVQVKDCRISDGTITVAGEGDGQVRGVAGQSEGRWVCGILGVGTSSVGSGSAWRIQRWRGDEDGGRGVAPADGRSGVRGGMCLARV